MRKIIFYGIGAFLMSCSGENSDSAEMIENAEERETDETDEIEISEEAVDVNSQYDYEPRPDNHVWQINDYAEYFLESKIANNSEEMDWEAGEMWYFETLDLKGGFARVEGAVEGNYEFALWRMANGNDLIGKTAMGCGPVCDYSYYFYEQNKDEGSEVTNEILPVDEIEKQRKKVYDLILDSYTNLEYPEDHQLRFFLPQKGTSMMVQLVVGADEITVPIVKLKWDKKRFSIEELYDNIQ